MVYLREQKLFWLVQFGVALVISLSIAYFWNVDVVASNLFTYVKWIRLFRLFWDCQLEFVFSQMLPTLLNHAVYRQIYFTLVVPRQLSRYIRSRELIQPEELCALVELFLSFNLLVASFWPFDFFMTSFQKWIHSTKQLFAHFLLL